MNRDEILKRENEIDPSEVIWCFVSNYYDGPIEGLVYYRDSVWRCCCFPEDIPDQYIYVILKLSRKELDQQIQAKEKFEEMVGTHFSYDRNGNVLPPSSATPETTKKYYLEHTEIHEPDPWEREIVAWFNTKVKDKQA